MPPLIPQTGSAAGPAAGRRKGPSSTGPASGRGGSAVSARPATRGAAAPSANTDPAKTCPPARLMTTSRPARRAGEGEPGRAGAIVLTTEPARDPSASASRDRAAHLSSDGPPYSFADPPYTPLGFD